MARSLSLLLCALLLLISVVSANKQRPNGSGDQTGRSDEQINGQNGNSNDNRGRSDSRRPIEQKGSPCTMSKSGMHQTTAGNNNLACKQSCKVKGCSKGVCQGQKRTECQCQDCTAAAPTTVSPPMAGCQVFGNPYLVTISEQFFKPVTMPGVEYLVLKPKQTNGKTNRWSVSFVAVTCILKGISDQLTTCFESAVVRVGNLIIKLHVTNYMQVNGKNTTVPWYYPDRTNPTITVTVVGLGFQLTTSDQLSLSVWGESWGVFNAPWGGLQMFMPKGDYDGFCNITKSTLPSERIECQRGEKVESQCAPIRDPNGPLQACIAQFPEQSALYSRNCGTDTCASTGCNFIQDFVDYCMKNNPALVIDWRSPQLCPLTCPTGMVYTQCASTCPNTCADPKGSELCKAVECKGGCVCKTGTLLENGGKCIQSSKCGCSDKMGYHTAGETWEDISCTQTCRCNGQRVSCSKIKGATPCPLPL